MSTIKKILIVEDEAIHAMYLSMLLTHNGFEVSGVAASGNEAFANVDTNCPDLALMDITLRNSIDGIEVTQQLREKYNFPVIFISGYDDLETKEKISLIADAWKLTKPIDENKLIELINQILSN